MSYIQTTEPHHASGETAALYQRLQGKLDYVPNYARVFCHRPEVMPLLAALQDSLKQNLDPRLWALISLAVAREINSSYCSLAFTRKLLKHHLSEAELLAVVAGRNNAPLEHYERVAMEVATKLARDSSSVSQADINRLLEAGFSDAEVFDVVAAAAWRCFFAKVPDSLGALPDAALGEIEPELLAQMLVGRSVDTNG